MSFPAVHEAGAFETATYRKITRRLMPYLFLCYILAYVDRVNVGFAKLQMQQDLSLSDTAFGFGAGVFFIGYFFFEVPANVILRKLGARRWLGPIMMVWGLVSASMIFTRGEIGFYALRFLLGVVESGFFPGVILYLTFWFPSRQRARKVAVFMSAIPLSGVLAGPLSGWILASMGGVAGLRAWQWLFIVEGIPSFIAGVVTLFFLTDSPAQAAWLTGEEKDLVRRQLAEEDQCKRASESGRHRLADTFRNPAVWLLCLVYFGVVAGNYGIGFWLPQVIQETLTRNPLAIGWITVIPYAASVVAMNLAGRHSDRTGERRWHLALAAFLGSVSFAASAIPGISGTAGLAALTLATVGMLSASSLFWALPTERLSGAAAAAGIAWINSVGNLAGYAAPFAVGLIRDHTHSMSLALVALSGTSLTAALVTLYVGRPPRSSPTSSTAHPG
jgi:D-galactonate transporter